MYTIAKAKQAIKNGINAYLMKDENGNYIMKEVNCLPFYLEGAPGIGKTEIVSQIAEEMGLGFVSFSLVHHTRNSLLGLPLIRDFEDGEKYTSFTMSEIIAKVKESRDAGHKEGILLLDEFPCMSESIMPAMLAFLQTKNIGTHALDRGWVLVLCGNPAKYNKSTHTFDAAVTDRIRKMEVEYSLDDFMAYAENKAFSKYIIAYLKLHSDHLYRFSKEKNSEELVTCRSWENLSHALDLYEMLGQEIDVPFIREFVKSDDVAYTFADYYRQNTCGISDDDRAAIFNGKYDAGIIDKINEKSFSNKWSVLDYLLTELDARSYGITKSKYKTLVKEITNIFDFLEKIDDGYSLRERLYTEINANKTLITAVSEVDCKPYIEICQEILRIRKIS